MDRGISEEIKADGGAATGSGEVEWLDGVEGCQEVKDAVMCPSLGLPASAIFFWGRICLVGMVSCFCRLPDVRASFGDLLDLDCFA